MVSLFVNHLTTLDFSYLCSERGLVGETWIVDAVLSGELNEQGMVFDFGHVKKQAKAALDKLHDHRLVVPSTHPAIKYHASLNQLTVNMTSEKAGNIQCKAPAQAILLVNAPAITIESVTPILEQALMAELPSNVSAVQLTLYPETIDTPFYHYSHGLKKHLGDCQRIAHGHRSRLIIEIDGVRSHSLEADWVMRWKDIYLATREDLLTTHSYKNQDYHTFGYTSDQGYFELTLPVESCYLLDTDTTVELIADHIAGQLAKHCKKPIKVTAYEGFNKGAISQRGVR
ncbi:MAG: 6-carboxytetrahydropterin synthase [Endozoicomonas sp. (ex Botrylloides leachii)]|nr:6-carboxytetrahydropterin synthase [Endozoicomonas sp. (ex Botrylloides leachii)]